MSDHYIYQKSVGMGKEQTLFQCESNHLAVYEYYSWWIYCPECGIQLSNSRKKEKKLAYA